MNSITTIHARRRLERPSILNPILGWGLGTAIGAAVVGVDMQLRGLPGAADFVVLALGLAAGTGVAAYSVRTTNSRQDVIARDLFGWLLALATSFLLFWFWEPVTELLSSVTQGSGNDVHLPVFDPMTSPIDSMSEHSGGTDLSPFQQSLIICVPLFGFVGGMLSSLFGRPRTASAIGPSVIVGLVWSIAALLASRLVIAGIYIFGSVLAASMGTWSTALGSIGLVAGCALAGLVGGSVAALIAIPIQRALIAENSHP